MGDRKAPTPPPGDPAYSGPPQRKPEPPPAPPRSRSELLLRTLVIAWDLDDEIAFEEQLRQARLEIGLQGAFPRSGTIKRKES